MKRLKGGPELKLPELKVPAFLADLFYDLRDRRLLPLVALAIVAIVAVPFLLGGSEEPESAPPEEASTSALESGESRGSTLTVVQSTPGLRDYRKRLRGQAATDPFKQRYTAADLTGTELGSGEDSSASTSSSTTSTSTSIATSDTKVTKTTTETSNGTTTKTTTTTDGTETDGGESVPGTDQGGSGAGYLTLYSFAIDVKIIRTTSTPDGGKDQAEPVIRNRVISPAALPSKETQVVTYMGINPETAMPLLLISDDVTAVFGEGKCLSGSRSCQLLEVEPGFPITFVYGPADTRFKINVLKIEPVPTGHS